MRSEKRISFGLGVLGVLAVALVAFGGCHYDSLIGSLVTYNGEGTRVGSPNKSNQRSAVSHQPTTAPATRPAQDEPSAADYLKGVEQWAQN